jgi:hypothetical protein
LRIYLINMKKSNYIEMIEKDNGYCFSVMDLPVATNELVKFSDEKFELIHSLSEMEQNSKINFKEKLYITKQGFYLYLLTTDDEFRVRVYFLQKQLTELRLIIGQLLKQTNLWKLQKKN